MTMCDHNQHAHRKLYLSNHLPLVPHKCVSELGEHCHHTNKCWFVVKWTLRNSGTSVEFQWKYKTFIHENAYENVVYEMSAILSRKRWVEMQFRSSQSEKMSCLQYDHHLGSGKYEFQCDKYFTPTMTRRNHRSRQINDGLAAEDCLRPNYVRLKWRSNATCPSEKILIIARGEK